MEGRCEERGSAKVSIDADCRGRASVKINPSYLTDILQSLGHKGLMPMYCNGDNPVVIYNESGDCTYVVMPLCPEDKASHRNRAWDTDENCIESTRLDESESEVDRVNATLYRIVWQKTKEE